jgi:hypothetical protein
MEAPLPPGGEPQEPILGANAFRLPQSVFEKLILGDVGVFG